jgi:lysophospholipase L1-like esterase
MPLGRHIRAGLRCCLLTAVGLALCRGGLGAEAPQPKENRWEPRIRRFEARDAERMPPADGILFVGSSSIVGWKLEECFPDLPVINRGFGGSQIADSVHFAPRIILPYRPKIIVLYAGDNDVASGKSPRRVLADYQQFVKTVHDALPNTRIVFIAIKPSLRRWQLVCTMREANELIRAVTQKDDRLGYVDVDKPMIGGDGKPRKELFKADGLHLNAEGYKLWTSLLLPHLTLEKQQ